MARPKKGTPGGEKATAKWWKTMEEKYGSIEGVHQQIRLMGSKGGQQKPCRPRGFAANPALARVAGARGGRVSRRTGVLNGQGKTNGEKNYVWKGDEDGFASQKD